MNQEYYDEDNPNLDGDYKAVLRIRKLTSEKAVVDVVDGPVENSKLNAADGRAHLAGQQQLQVAPARRLSQQTLRLALFHASEENDVNTLRSYIDDGRIDRPLTDSRFRDPETGETVLHRALSRGSMRIVEFLLTTEHGAPLACATYDVDVGGEVSKRTCLHQATESGKSGVVRMLLAVMSDPAERLALLRKETMYVPNGRRPRSVTCLHIAAMKGFSDIVEYFVSDCGIDVNEANEHKDTALMWAALEGHAATVDVLIRLSADVNARNDQGSTALHYSIRNGHADVAQRLLASGHADVNARRRRGLVCPLVLAATMGYEKIVRLLLQNGADVNVRIHGSETALHYAAGEGHLDVCQTLIDAGIDLDAADSRGETALIEAAMHGEVVLVKYLLAKGANVNHQTLDRRSVWTYAVDAENDRMLLVLLAHITRPATDPENGIVDNERFGNEGLTANVSMLSMRLGFRVQLPLGISPLHMAAARGDASKLRLMLANQLDPEARDPRGNTFVHVAATANRWQILDEFAVGRLASIANDEGNTPLHEACRLAHGDAVRVLLAKSRLRERNKSDRTALHEAARSAEGDHRKRTSIVRMVIAQIQQGHYWELLDAQDERGYTALHWAVKAGNRAAVRELRSLSLREQDEDGNTPLHLAAASGDAETFSELLRLQPTKRRDELEIANSSGMTPLRLAVYHNSSAILEECIRTGSDLVAVGQDGQTLLHWIADLMKADASMVKIYMQAVRAITDLAVLWWTAKKKRQTPSHTSVAYEELRREALSTLFGTALNSSGFTVVQYSAVICCVPMVEHALSLKNVYKFKVGNFMEYDVTDLTPDTIVPPAKMFNKVHPVPLVSVLTDVPANYQDTEKMSASHTDMTAIEARSLNGDVGNVQPPVSLIELVVSNEEPLSAAAIFSVQPIADMVRSYWSTYQWLYAACMMLHLGYMVLLTAYAPELQKSIRLGYNMTVLLNSQETTMNCTSMQPPSSTQYILLSEPIVLLLIQFFQLLSMAWQRKHNSTAAIRSRNCCSSASNDPTATIGPAILRACGTVFALATIAWLGMFSFCVVNQDYMLSIAILFGWIFPLNFTSGFEALHQFSLMLRHMIFRDIMRFLTVYAFILCGVGFAQHVIIGAFDQYGDYAIQDTLFTTLQWLVGMSSFWERPPYSDDGLYKRYGFLAALYIFYTIMSTIILINLLIAMMSDSYTGVKNHSAMLWKVASIELALDTQRSLSPLKPLLTCLRDYLDSVDRRALRFDKKRRRWYLKVNKARRIGPKNKGIADVDPAIVQLSQKVSALQEQLDLIGSSLKQLLPKVTQDASIPAASPQQQADSTAKTAWRKVVGRMTIAPPPPSKDVGSSASPKL